MIFLHKKRQKNCSDVPKTLKNKTVSGIPLTYYVYLGVRYLVLEILLNHTVAFAFNNFSLLFL
jgi:hypothetical protein